MSLSEPLKCFFCLKYEQSDNPVVGSDQRRDEDAYKARICRRCIIANALAMDPKGERIIVRVPQQERGAKTDWIPLGLQSHEIKEVVDGYAAWTIRARDELRCQIRSEIDGLRREAAEAEANIEASINGAADLGIDPNAPEPVMPDGTAVAATVEPGKGDLGMDMDGSMGEGDEPPPPDHH